MRRAVRAVVAVLALSASAVGSPLSGAPLSLRDLAAARGIRIGAAIVDDTVLSDPMYAATLGREFDVGVSENHMKWAPIHPTEPTFDYTVADAQVGFTAARGMAYRGHNLAWHVGNPSWLLTGGYTRDQLIGRLRDHIRNVVGRYAGRVSQWDVVNEAFDGVLDPAGDPWSSVIGFPDYLDIAFTAAREADPNAKLYYNDYLIEAPGLKFDAVLALVSGLKARGVPIDGVGFQAHLGSRPCDESCANAMLTNMMRLQQLGLEVAITELDVAIELPTTPQKLDDQASVYRTTMQACLLAPNCHTFVLWGFTDLHSWVPAFRPGYGAALPFDEQYQPKPAYAALADTLANPPAAPSCTSFTSRLAAQAAFDSGVLGAPLLDPDGNGVACETLPAPVPAPVPASVPVVRPAFTG